MSISTRKAARSIMAAVIAVLAVLITAPPASAQQGEDPGGDLQVRDAYNCYEPAPGPGTWNKSCMDVEGYSVRVDRAQVFLVSTTAPHFPADICNVKFEVWGRKAGSGIHWEQSGWNPGCGRGSLSLIFYPGEHFENGSYFCSRTTWNGQGSSPNCIIIKV